MSESYLNKVELKGGEIVLFHRPNSKKPVYHVRIHVRGMVNLHGEKLTYVQKSTGEQDLEEAKFFALKLYNDLRDRARNKQPAKSFTWADMYELWFKDKRNGLEAHYSELAKSRLEGQEAGPFATVESVKSNGRPTKRSTQLGLPL